MKSEIAQNDSYSLVFQILASNAIHPYKSAVKTSSNPWSKTHKSKLKLFYRLLMDLFCHILFALSLSMFQRGSKLSKWFDAFQVLISFTFFLRVTCVIFACATNTEACQAIVARYCVLGNCNKPPINTLFLTCLRSLDQNDVNGIVNDFIDKDESSSFFYKHT